MRNAFLIVTAV